MAASPDKSIGPEIAGNTQIPSVIWYDRCNDLVKAGAEAEEHSDINTAEEQGWVKVELLVLPFPSIHRPVSPRCMHQLHTPSPSEIGEVGHGLHEAPSSTEIKIGCSSVWRLPQVPFPLHPVLHH